jgi:hypothetical protein
MSINEIINKSILKKDINIVLSFCVKSQDYETNGITTFLGNQYKGYLYFLIKDNLVVYIGCSENRNRISGHKNKDYDFFYYLIYENYDFYKDETKLIKTFKTKYNKCNLSKTN